MIFSSIIAGLISNWLRFLMNTWNDFTPIVKLTMFLILALSSLSRYTFYHPIFKIPQISISLCIMPLFDVMLDCLGIRWIVWLSLIKMHIVYYISILTLMFYDSAWEAVQVHTLTLLYDHDLTFWLSMLILKSPSLPRYL